MKTIQHEPKLRTLWKRHRTVVVGLMAAVLTSLAATGWADSLYIITSEEEDAAIILDQNQAEAPDLSSQLVYVSNGSRGYDVMLNEGISVTILHEGARLTVQSRRESVSTLLNRLQLAPSSFEMVNVELLEDSVTLSIASDLSYYQQVFEVDSYDTIRVENPELAEGEEKVVQEGVSGLRTAIYDVVWSNGEEISRQFVHELNSTAVDRIVEYGPVREEEPEEITPLPDETTADAPKDSGSGSTAETPSTTTSTASGRSGVLSTSENADGSGILYLKDGTELRYSGVRTMTATAYTAGHGGVGTRTATGTQVHRGTVAVDRNVIPLGTRMYIVADGGIVYGLAVAEDTGVRGNTIDLYCDTYNQCIQFGRRSCTVYILE